MNNISQIIRYTTRRQLQAQLHSRRSLIRHYHLQRGLSTSSTASYNTSNQQPLQQQKEAASIPLREHIERQNLKTIMRLQISSLEKSYRNITFPNTQNFEDLMDYDPILTQCIAKWLWTNYKINDHPYFDLHIVSIFSDLPRALHLCRSIMRYYRLRLTGDKFSLIHFHLVPLYDCSEAKELRGKSLSLLTSSLLNDIPGDVNLALNSSVFPLVDISESLSISDPVYILMLNDVVKVMSQDLVRFNSQNHLWEQCYVDQDQEQDQNTGDNTDGYRLNFKSSLEFWCDRTLSAIKESDRPVDQPFYVPTQLVQLFDAINLYLPEHRLLLIDSPVTRRQASLFSRLKTSLGWNSLGTAEAIRTSEGLRFKNDFNLVQSILNRLNQTSRTYEVMSLGELVDLWTEAKVKNDTPGLPEQFTKKLGYQLKLISNSSLQVLYS